ncbi:MAG: amidohydrolase family protein [Steroidobacteraceae bacterium]
MLTRRNFLSATGAAAAANLLYRTTWAQQARRQRIDVHHHILPPEYVRLVGRTAIGAPAANKQAPLWTPADSINGMDQYGVASALTSISAPGIWSNDRSKAKRLARLCNVYAAQLMTDYPGRFGAFATLPLPDIKASLQELDYAFDTLHCDGVGLMTNYNDRYLGDAAFVPLFDALNRRKAVVYVHPTSCDCDLGVMTDIPTGMIEFPHSTTRAVVSLLFSGTISRCPDIKFIFSHAGGTIPFLASRIQGVAASDKQFEQRVPGGVLPALKSLHYDTAGSVNAFALPLLIKLVSAKQVLMGTDFPFSPAGIKSVVEGLQGLGLSEGELGDIQWSNAQRLLPRFA